MKKLIAILLAVAMLASMATVASAEEYEMALKTTVPAATYTLYIPATLEVPYGAEEVSFPLPEVVESAGFRYKDLCIRVWDPVFFGEGTSFTMPMSLVANCHNPLEDHENGIAAHNILGPSPDNLQDAYLYYVWGSLNERGCLESDCYVIIDGELHLLTDLSLLFNQADWGYLEPGEHTGHIVFSSYVVPDVIEGK